MRAVFTLDINQTQSGERPSDADFLKRIRSHGWEDRKLEILEDTERLTRYAKIGDDLWKEMPELASEEKEYIIFYGILQSTRTKFIVTRMTPSQATFRLLHHNLAKLQDSTSMVIEKSKSWYRLIREKPSLLSAIKLLQFTSVGTRRS